MPTNHQNRRGELIQIRLVGEDTENLTALEGLVNQSMSPTLIGTVSRTRLCRIILLRGIRLELETAKAFQRKSPELPLSHKETKKAAAARKRIGKRIAQITARKEVSRKK